MAGDRYRFTVHSNDTKGAEFVSVDQNNTSKPGHIHVASPMSGVGLARGSFHLGKQDWSPWITHWSGGQKPKFTGEGMECKNSTWFTVATRFPIAVGMKYKVSIALAKASGSGTFYCGVDSLDANFNPLRKDKATSYNYGTMLHKSLKAGVSSAVYSGTYQWFNSTTSSYHNRFDPGACYFDVVIITNYQGTGISNVYGLNVQCIS